MVGQPFKLLDWQKDLIRTVYDNEDASGKLLTRKAVCSIGRKNGKTTLIAALLLAHLVGPMRVTNGQLISAANDRNQASIVFELAAKMLRMNGDLLSLVNILDSTKQIRSITNGSTYKALSSESGTAHGLSPTFAIFDELAQARNRKLYDAIATASGAHKESLFWVISTQTEDDKHIMSHLVDQVEAVNRGEVQDPTLRGIVYSAPMDADIFDPKTWALANPSLHHNRNIEDIQALADEARRIPASEMTFRHLFLNQRINSFLDNRLFTKEVWQTCDAAPDLETHAEDDRWWWGGLDLSGTTDHTAFIMVSSHGDVLTRIWTPEATLDARAQRDAAPYRLWVEQGFMKTTPGKVVDYAFVAKELGEIGARYPILKIGVDPARFADLERECTHQGLSLPFEKFHQGFISMGGAVESLIRHVLNAELRHGSHPVLNFHISNSKVVRDAAGNQKIDKQASATRVDAAVALAMACRMKDMHPSPHQMEIFEVEL